MRHLAFVALAMGGLATPALATEWVSCADAGGEASFDYLAGDGVGVLAIVGMTITVGEKVWASDVAYGPGEAVAVGQAFENGDTVMIDAIDPAFNPVAQLRLYRASEGEDYVTAGTLRMPGYGAWAVSCEGP